jgi:uncharacterized protein YecT (DUF1311 family)
MWWLPASALSIVAAVALAQQGTVGPSPGQQFAAALKEYNEADHNLNRAYQRLAAALEPDPRAKLKAAELAWLRYRDAEGAFRASEFKGAKLEPTARLGYLEHLTRGRTKELVDAYKQFAGD